MTIEFRVMQKESVSSTNDLVKRAIEDDEPEGFAVRAFQQTGGYGRQGRAWASPFGGMYQSLLLRPQAAGVPMSQLPTLTLLASLAVRGAIVDLLPAAAEAVQIKWPNDLVVSQTNQTAELPDAAAFRKLCGISVEAHAGGVCVGIGVNVLPPRRALELTGKNDPVYLADLGFDISDARAAINAVGDAVLWQFAQQYSLWCMQGFAPFASEYAAHAALDGRVVSIANIRGEVAEQGTAAGIDEHGRLLVRLLSGEVRAVSSGEAHLV